jgi:hypothetical protein
MAEAKQPRAAGLALPIMQKEAVGYSVQVWQPPAEGWTLVEDLGRFGRFDEASAAAQAMVTKNEGALLMILAPPPGSGPNFGRTRRG